MALLTPEAPTFATPTFAAPSRVRPHVRRAVPADREPLIRFVEDLSPSSSQHRFLTGMGGRVPGALVEQLLSGGRGGGALVAAVEGRIVGHGLWARSSGPRDPVAEVALVVADAYQRLGIGSMLVDAMLAEMTCHGIDRVQVLTGAGNRPVLAMLTKLRPGVKPTDRDGAVVTYEVAVRP